MSQSSRRKSSCLLLRPHLKIILEKIRNATIGGVIHKQLLRGGWLGFRHHICICMFRVIQVKLANCKWLFETENMDRFLIKWYFYYHKGGKFYMVPQKSRINLARHSKSLSKSDFPFWNYHFFLVLYTVWYDFDRDFECLSRFFSGFLKYHIKFPTFLIIKIPFD